MEQDSTTPAATRRQRIIRGITIVTVVAVLVGLGTWVASSFIKSSDGVTPADSELTAAQHTSYLVRSLRIAAASDAKPHIESVSDTVDGSDTLECGSRFSIGLQHAVGQFYSIAYLSTVAGSRSTDTESWSTQQSQADDGALALQQLFPDECSPKIPVTFDLNDAIRFSDEISIRQTLLLSDELVEEWSQLYLLAETAEQRQIALAGLWQVLTWESSASPGYSPLTFNQY
ncbi:MAG TPA: hypothetical protein H9884_01080 [Candidatus Yaniella excrementigallinarum]|nr:hypothetical protein [Candidatus Yaniella excrementigallinarum]